MGEDWYSWYNLKYILYEYELHLASGEPVKMSWDYLINKEKQDTIEHILPQTHKKHYWKKRWNKEQINEALNDLGDLTLTYNNSAYGNKGFDQKKGTPGEKHCYANSSLFMERALAKYDEWTYKEFIERRNMITSWIKERWHVGEAENLDIILEEEVEEDEITAALSEAKN